MYLQYSIYVCGTVTSRSKGIMRLIIIIPWATYSITHSLNRGQRQWKKRTGRKALRGNTAAPKTCNLAGQ